MGNTVLEPSISILPEGDVGAAEAVDTATLSAAARAIIRIGSLKNEYSFFIGFPLLDI
jgi:hypothetical protein